MRIVLDLQGLQGGSRSRGIGRSTLSLTKAIIRAGRGHEFFIALNGMFPQTIEAIRTTFADLLPQDHIVVWNAVGPTSPIDTKNAFRADIAALTREAFLASLKPDMVHIANIFEGYGDDCIQTIGRIGGHVPTSVTVHDLIPLCNKEQYLDNDPRFSEFYHKGLENLKSADLYLAVSESAKRELIDHLAIDSGRITAISSAADDGFKLANLAPIDAPAFLKRHGLSRPFIMYSGAADSRKNHLRLLQAYGKLPKELRSKYQLVFVGELHDSQRQQFEEAAKTAKLDASDYLFTGRVDEDDLVAFYRTCHLFVFPSIHEGFGLPALEAMSCGAPTIGSNRSSIPEVIGLEEALFDPFDVDDIAQTMTRALTDKGFRDRLIQNSHDQADKFDWSISANLALEAMEAYHQKAHYPRALDIPDYNEIALPKIAQFIEDYEPKSLINRSELGVMVAHLAHNPKPRKKQFLIDISELIRSDARTGVQRVTRSVLSELVLNPPCGYDVVPVYCALDEDYYRYAYKYLVHLKGDYARYDEVEDLRITYGPEDIFFGLDLQHHIVIRNKAIFAQMKAKGVEVYFLLYDLLPIQFPAMFVGDLSEYHARWLDVLAKSDGVISISRTVSDEFEAWLLQQDRPLPLRPLKLGWAHIGADLKGSVPSTGMPDDAEVLLETFKTSTSFLMVGTIEPRKGHEQILDAFDRLWAKGANVNLVLVGKAGWNNEALITRIETHEHFGKKLFWLSGTSDEYLEAIYQSCTALIAASFGEGFGLPLIEAAQYNIPLLVRDIPVFREVAGDHAAYFKGDTPNDIATTISNWVKSFKKGNVPSSQNLPWLTWSECAQGILDVIFKKSWYRQWPAVAACDQYTEYDLINFATTAAMFSSLRPGFRRVMIDVSGLTIDDLNPQYPKGFLEFLMSLYGQFDIALVHASPLKEGYFYAYDFACGLFGIPDLMIPQVSVEYRSDDIFLGLYPSKKSIFGQERQLKRMRLNGVFVAFYLDAKGLKQDEDQDLTQRYNHFCSLFDGVIANTSKGLDEYVTWLEANQHAEAHELKLSALVESPKRKTAKAVADFDLMALSFTIQKALAGEWASFWRPQGAWVYSVKHPAFNTIVGQQTEDGVRSTGAEGYLLFGPYIQMEPGQYSIRVKGEAEKEDVLESFVDIACTAGINILAAVALKDSMSDTHLAELNFTLDHRIDDFEVRFWVSDGSLLELKTIEIEMVSA